MRWPHRLQPMLDSFSDLHQLDSAYTVGVNRTVNMLELKIDKRALDDLHRAFRHIPEKAPKAIAAALNKTLPGIRTDAVREVTQAYWVKVGDARKTMTIRKASPSRLEATVRSDGEAIPLYKFRVKPKTITKKRPAGGVHATVKRGDGGRIKHSFIAPVGERNRVMMRNGKARSPIKQLFGPAVPLMLKREDGLRRVEAKGAERFDKNLDHEIDRILKGFGK